ncbi:hypothetical protein [Streptomyces virginiae]|uniref:hypothetical protein n=1 Tax=Streptomyces virginiae TaxID=1961 RepID=UPI0022549EC7|nr:hypothetical protein [Streptomyces virginiae]MCX4714856.1 hypothetical protein [Streptomyces virginiae]MCX5272574.1 hypothetical protein [Streptomyces virginiae]
MISTISEVLVRMGAGRGHRLLHQVVQLRRVRGLPQRQQREDAAPDVHVLVVHELAQRGLDTPAPEGVQGRLDELPVEARVGVVHRGLEQCVEGLVGKDHTVLQGPAQRRPGPVHPGGSAILDIRNS